MEIPKFPDESQGWKECRDKFSKQMLAEPLSMTPNSTSSTRNEPCDLRGLNSINMCIVYKYIKYKKQTSVCIYIYMYANKSLSFSFSLYIYIHMFFRHTPEGVLGSLG